MYFRKVKIATRDIVTEILVPIYAGIRVSRFRSSVSEIMLKMRIKSTEIDTCTHMDTCSDQLWYGHYGHFLVDFYAQFLRNFVDLRPNRRFLIPTIELKSTKSDPKIIPPCIKLFFLLYVISASHNSLNFSPRRFQSPSLSSAKRFSVLLKLFPR